ncbi:MAG TPA: hypothetical protein VFA89_07090 [Terriglobales bacterium]|nr:hypothetical protein [Terriglobales bacterium]
MATHAGRPWSRTLAVAIFLSLFAALASPLLAQNFSPVPPLAFTKPFGGTNPLPQVVNITSTGASIHFTPVASTSSGGNWLSISPAGNGCCFTPDAMTVSVNASNTLPAGIYQGQIVFTSYPTGNITMTVPVTLTVASADTAFFDNTPGALSFSLQTNATGVPMQAIQIRNGGTGSLSWSAKATTSDGSGWLTLSPARGTAPTTVTVRVAVENLPGAGSVPGTYIGMLTFQAQGSSITIPVSVTVGDDVFRQVNPINFTMPFGGANPLPQIMTVASTAGTSIHFTPAAFTSKGGNWLSISPSGNGCCFTPEAFTVKVSASTLPAGTYTGQIAVTEYPSNTPALMVPVTLTIAATNSDFFDNMAGQLSFSVQTNGTSAPSQTLQILDAGPASFSWTASTSTADNGGWLSISASSGTTPSVITVTINPQKLPNQAQIPGTFVGQISFQTAGSSVTVPISATVGDNVFRQINPMALSMPFGGANPLPQVLTVASTGGTSIHFTPSAATAKGGNWLTISPSGNGCCFTPEAFTVSVNASTLAAGTYTGEINILEYPSNTPSMTVPVTLTIAATGTQFFDSVPGQLSFSLQTSATSVPAQTVQILNGGPGSFAWTGNASTADTGNWLIVSPLSGSTPSTVTVSIDPQNLPNSGQIAGTFVGQIVFTSSGSSVTVPVSVSVGDNVFRQINPIAFTMPFGGANPLPQILTAASTGGTSIHFTPSTATSKGGNWLSISPSGNGCCFTPEAFTVSVNASTLAAGTYTAEINFIEYPSNTPSMTVPVTLTVGATGTSFFDSLPGQLSFSLQTGATSATAQVLQIRNAGTGPLSWTSTVTTADSGDWLSITPVSGTTPTTVAVSINPVNLPNQAQIPGTFVGQIAFQTGSGNVTVPVNVVVGDDVFRQINPLTFIMPSGGSNPLPQIVTVGATGASVHFTPSFATAKGGKWLTVSPTGTGCCFTPEAFTVSITGGGLAAGTYAGEINFIQYPSSNLSITVPVTLVVAPTSSPLFDNTPGQVSFSFSPSTQNPPAQSIQVLNAGSGSLSWTLTSSTADTSPWLSVSPKNGTAPSTVNVRIVTQNLPGQGLIAGTYVGQIALQAKSGGTTVPVSVDVGDPVFVQLPALSFQAARGTNPTPQNVNINSTSGSIHFTPVAASGKGGNWLSVSPSGTGCCFTPDTLTVSVNSASLASGKYVGQITLSQYPSNSETMTIPVILTVTGGSEN